MTLEQIENTARLGFNVLLEDELEDDKYDVCYVVFNNMPKALVVKRFLTYLTKDDEIIFYNDDYEFEDKTSGGHVSCVLQGEDCYYITVSKEAWSESFFLGSDDLSEMIADTWDHEDYSGMYLYNIMIKSKKK